MKLFVFANCFLAEVTKKKKKKNKSKLVLVPIVILFPDDVFTQ
jgi:apolipoprotein N-acyltransferase